MTHWKSIITLTKDEICDLEVVTRCSVQILKTRDFSFKELICYKIESIHTQNALAYSMASIRSPGPILCKLI